IFEELNIKTDLKQQEIQQNNLKIINNKQQKLDKIDNFEYVEDI
ncbi:4966_t:CDS:1, partial [Racocetra persica]